MPVFAIKRTETYWATVEAPSKEALEAAISGEDSAHHEWLHSRLDKGYDGAETTYKREHGKDAAQYAYKWPVFEA